MPPYPGLRHPGLRRILCVSALLVPQFSLIPGAALLAQRAQGSVSDLVFHKFQPKVSPEAAAAAAPLAQHQGPAANGMSAFAARQVHMLAAEKKSRTAAQQKIDSNVLYTERMLQGQDAAPGVLSLNTGVDLDAKDNIVVDMSAHVTESLLSKLSSAGVKILYSNASLRSIRAIIAPGKIEEIAASPDVIFISPRQEASSSRINLGNAGLKEDKLQLAPGFAGRAAKVRQQLANAMSTTGTPITWQGSVGTEGDVTHQTLDARAIYGINGAGLKIGVLSDGVTSAAQSQATGDLPPTCGVNVSSPCLTVLSGQAGSGDEGTAILEILHDMVPGANLYFATADNSITSFAANIRALQAAGCNIIVDDVFYYIETPFQDGQAASVVSTSNGGVVTQAVNDVVADGVFYFSSAGNEGNLDIGTSGTYEGDFVSQPATSPLPSGSVHNFGGGNGYDVISSSGEQVLGLFWSDPLGGSGNDYDLYVLDSGGDSILSASTNIQNGTQDPVEEMSGANLVAGNQVVVFQNAGAQDRFIHLVLFRGEFTVATSGETHGHSAASGAYTVAATPAAVAFGPPTPNGPYPGPFVATDQIEWFSSDGLRHIFFNADSTPITSGNFSSTGGEILNKPDITAADGVSVTGVGGFASPFYGTSAAAPAAASVAALVLSAKPSITADEMKTTLESTAVDIMASGFDRDSGNGIVMALPAVQSLGIAGNANVELATIVAVENPGNGNGIIEAGEGALLEVQLKNTYGVKSATGIHATLSTSTPGVTILQPATSTYADLAIGATGENANTPFQFTLADNVPCATLVDFTLTVTYSGGQTRVLPFSVQTGIFTVTNTLGSTPTLPASITFATGTETARLDRNGVASACGTPKAFPGTISGSHTFDGYTFQACQAICLEPRLNAGSAGTNLFEALYSPSFDATNIGANYAGDPGSSNSIQTFGVDVAANTAYTIVVSDVEGNPPPPPAPPNTYTLQIPSCAFNCSAYPLPVALAQNVTVHASSVGSTANASINNGSNDPDGGPITITQSPAGPYPQGTTTVTLTVTNKVGAFAQATATVTVTNPAVVVTWNPAPIEFGAKLGPAQLNATANIPGKFVYTPAAGTKVTTTTETLKVVFTPTNTALAPVTKTVSLEVTLVSVSPTSLNFGTVYLGSVTKKDVTVTNLGPSAVTIHNPLVSILTQGDSREFVAANLCPASLASHASCNIQISYVAGPFYNQQSATLSVMDSSPDSPQKVSMTALTIDPEATLSVTSLSFGTVKKGTTSAAKPMKLTNSGATAMTLSGFSFSGADAGDFKQTNNCSGSLGAGSSCTLELTFKPGATGARSAKLVVKDNAKNNPQSVSLSGSGN